MFVPKLLNHPFAIFGRIHFLLWFDYETVFIQTVEAMSCGYHYLL